MVVCTEEKTTMKGIESMAYETKVILIALSKIAVHTNAKEVYKAIAEMANAEGVILKPYDEAKAELEAEK